MRLSALALRNSIGFSQNTDRHATKITHNVGYANSELEQNKGSDKPLMKHSGLLLRLLALAWLAMPLASAGFEAGENALPGISFKGFGTLGVARSDNGQAQLVRDLSQPQGVQAAWSVKTDSVFGLQANVSLNEQTEAVIQAVSRYRYNGSTTPELTWAFLSHDFSPDFSARLGRLGTEFYMLADSRLVGYANLTVRPPSDYYGPLVISYFGGIDLSATTKMNAGPLQGLLRGKLFAGYAAEKTPFVAPLTWDLNGSLLVGGHLDYLTGPWQMRLGHAQIRFKHDQPMNQLVGMNILDLVPELSVSNKWARYDSLGVVYDKGPLQIQGMINQIRYETSAYENTRAAYTIAAYRLGQITPYVGYSRVKSNPSVLTLTTTLPPWFGTQIAALTGQTHSDQHTLSLGARWDFQRNLALKAQLDLIRGTPQSVFPFRNETLAWNGRMNVFSLALDFVF